MLVVAVDPRLMAAIQKFVERRGLADVVTAWGIEQAKDLLHGIHFDVAIIDIDLPYGRGQQLMVEVAVSHPGTRRVAIGRASRRGLRTLVDAGLVDDAVAKPVDMDEFLQAAFGLPPDDLRAVGATHYGGARPGASMAAHMPAANMPVTHMPATHMPAAVGIPRAVTFGDSTPLPI